MNRAVALGQTIEAVLLGLVGTFGSFLTLSMKEILKFDSAPLFFVELIGIIAFWFTLAHFADNAKTKVGMIAFRTLTYTVTGYGMYLGLSSLP